MTSKSSEKSMFERESDPKFTPVFMGFTLQIQNSGNQNGADLKAAIRDNAVKIIQDRFGVQIQLTEDDSLDPDLIEITIRRQQENQKAEKENQNKTEVAQAWNLTYQLQQLDKVIYAEPRFSLQIPSGYRNSPEQNSPETNSGDPDRQKVIREVFKNPNWHFTHMRIEEAWALFKTKERLEEGKVKIPGEGIVIALPDTGFLPHPELDEKVYSQDGDERGGENEYLEGRGELLTEQKIKNEVENPEGRFKGMFPVSSWHGTATASLMISREEGDVTGVAPGAQLKPYHLGPTTLDHFEFFVPGLAKAINDAAKDENVRVISISFGGYPALSLRRAIINAQRKGIIVVASAGNSSPFAIWPSTYANVISVASSAYSAEVENSKIASHSARGSRIDVAAPGELVMVAVPGFENGKFKYTAKPQSGTSFSAPLVAGVAALWLSYHGWQKLKDKYGDPTRIPMVFDKLLRETCTKPNGWNERRWGAGIVNAEALLEADLPEADDPYIQEARAYQETDHIRLDMGGIKTFSYLFEEALSEQSFLTDVATQIFRSIEIGEGIFWWVFGQVFGRKTGKELRQYLRMFGREIAFLLATNFALYRQMEDLVKNISPSGEFNRKLNDMLNELRKQASDRLNVYIVGTKDIASDDSSQV